MLFALVATCATSLPQKSYAQFGGVGFVQPRVVGGVNIDAKGVVSNLTINPALSQAIAEAAKSMESQGSISQASSLRWISLRSLEAAITKAHQEKKSLAPEYQYLAGLTRIEYVIVSPEKNDIFVGGPAEGWRFNEQGIVVGNQSGQPVIQLEDFLAAMRSSESARTGEGISVSIDPTDQGVKSLAKLFDSMRAQQVGFNPQMKGAVEKALGDQVVTLTGVPADSRFAQVLVAADYKMKRYSMGFETAPIEKFPSVMEMAASKNGRLDSASPRFWMECNYEPTARSEDNSVWQIRGQGVKTLTENSRYTSAGAAKNTGKQNKYALRWANMMTERFEELSKAEPCFRELRNVIDLSVVAAIISRHGLADKAGLKMPAILGISNVALPSWNAPKTVPAQCSFFQTSNSWLVSASGGVQLDSWGVAQNQAVVPQLKELAATANSSSKSWWWNAGK
jgi:hypothetical protein